MELSDDDLKCVAGHRASKSYLPWLRNGTLFLILVAVFLGAIELLTLLWVLASLWTLFCIYIWYRITRKKRNIYQGLKNEQEG